MIPPQIQGWPLLHKARLQDQDIVGVMTMTGGSPSVKLVEKAVIHLFTDDVLQSVDRSQGKDSGNSRRQHACEVIEEVPEEDDGTHMNEDESEVDDPYVNEEEHFLANEDVVSDIDVDLAVDDEDCHEALLGYREARDLVKEARVARGFYPVFVPIRSDKPMGRGKRESSSGKTGRGKGARGSECSGRQKRKRKRTFRISSWLSVEFTSLFQVRCDGSVLLPKRWMMVPQIQRNEVLGLTSVVHGPAIFLTNPVMKTV